MSAIPAERSLHADRATPRSRRRACVRQAPAVRSVLRDPCKALYFGRRLHLGRRSYRFLARRTAQEIDATVEAAGNEYQATGALVAYKAKKLRLRRRLRRPKCRRRLLHQWRIRRQRPRPRRILLRLPHLPRSNTRPATGCGGRAEDELRPRPSSSEGRQEGFYCQKEDFMALHRTILSKRVTNMSERMVRSRGTRAHVH